MSTFASGGLLATARSYCGDAIATQETKTGRETNQETRTMTKEERKAYYKKWRQEHPEYGKKYYQEHRREKLLADAARRQKNKRYAVKRQVESHGYYTAESINRAYDERRKQ
jgi:hypothetical protein